MSMLRYAKILAIAAAAEVSDPGHMLRIHSEICTSMSPQAILIDNRLASAARLYAKRFR